MQVERLDYAIAIWPTRSKFLIKRVTEYFHISKICVRIPTIFVLITTDGILYWEVGDSGGHRLRNQSVSCTVFHCSGSITFCLVDLELFPGKNVILLTKKIILDLKIFFRERKRFNIDFMLIISEKIGYSTLTRASNTTGVALLRRTAFLNCTLKISRRKNSVFSCI